ncbi:MAG: hypothetical protein O7D91_08035 [Planctomycetota bacterium]|nr:hypothetical protein [Planctomycetota bacterium]
MLHDPKKKGPLGLQAGEGTANLDLWKYRPRPSDPQAEAQQSSGEQLPHCPLHGLNIIHRLPDGCPLRHANPFEGLLQLKNAAWAQVRAPRFELLNEGLLGLDVVNTCERCVPAMLAKKRIIHLQKKLHAAPQGGRGHFSPPNGDGVALKPQIRVRISK